jgi:hypothetical protein
VLDIVTDADLTEAVLYFQSGVDDVPVSSAASFYSARSSGSRRITVRVHVRVDYDGPSLSDTSSLFSLEEGLDFDEDHDLQDALSLTDSFGAQGELEDDQVTISSKDTGLRPPLSRSHIGNRSSETLTPTAGPSSLSTSGKSFPKIGLSQSIISQKPTSPRPRARSPLAQQQFSFDADIQQQDVITESPPPSESDYESAAARFPADPSAVFERLKFMELTSRGDANALLEAHPQAQIDRGKQWLREQSSRTALSPLLGPKSESEAMSANSSAADPLDDFERSVEEDLALQRGSSGQYYYTYRGGSVSQDWASDYQESSVAEEEHANGVPSTSQSVPNGIGSHLENYPPPKTEIPAELLPFIDSVVPPEHTLTDCSSCGRILDSIRYVCATCGEKEPRNSPFGTPSGSRGKSRFDFHSHQQHNHLHHTYPPPHLNGLRNHSSHSSSASSTSSKDKPLPGLPGAGTRRPPAPSEGSSMRSDGYELCANCIQSMGVMHAIEPTEGSSSSSEIGGSPDSPDALSAMRRSAPKRKGKMRHAYLEKYWAGTSWMDVGT